MNLNKNNIYFYSIRLYNKNRLRKKVNLAIIAANNHYAGFGPGTVNIFRKMLGLSEAKWEEMEEERPSHDLKLKVNLYRSLHLTFDASKINSSPYYV